ncbi:hypothetical protein IWQ62_000476 [Dispira parvispora]|uniref:Queuosine 5'-phosphate N-glycosylase/hydrolase n=1 Tax=Dispira parvispora TaxID=1520584 RepID=A0A9W8B037_9FUNG|nr:hypothetical protein IWQ62_000476 [Dispira parvispora]
MGSTNDIDLVTQVHQTCEHLVLNSSEQIEVNDEAIDQFLDQLDIARFQKLSTGWITFPLKFDTVEDEVNLVAILDLLNFGSGYRQELHAACDRGAAQTIIYGCMGLHISQTPVDAQGLQKLTLGDVSGYFGIPLLGTEEAHPSLPGVTISQPSVLRNFAEALTKVLNETGEILQAKGYRSLGHFILDVTTSPSDAAPDWRPSAVELVDRLARTFPAFQDYRVKEGTSVYILKKAQLLAGDLHGRFQDPTSPAYVHFNFDDVDQLSVFSDNVLPTVLLHLGVLKLRDNTLQHKLDKLEPVSDTECWLLRAAAVYASDCLVNRCRARIDAVDETTDSNVAERANQLASLFNAVALDHYLWHIGKDPEIRKLPRLVYQDTVYF